VSSYDEPKARSWDPYLDVTEVEQKNLTTLKALETKIPPLVVALISFAMIWIAYRRFPEMRWNYELQKPVAFGLFIVAFLISALGVLAFKKAQTTADPMTPSKASSLVDFGIYKFTRNPMYLGMLISLFGVFSYFPTPLAIIGLVFYVLYMTRFQIKPEERALASIFGDDYLNYKEKVARWLLV